MPTLEEIFGAPATEELIEERPPLGDIFAEPSVEAPVIEAPIVEEPTEERPTAFLPTGEGLTQTQRQERAIQDVATYARPTIETAGLLGGEAVGFAAGLPGVAVGAPALGAVVGGGLGFAAGKNLADLLEQKLGIQESKSVMQELSELPEELLTGAAYSAGGQVVGPVIKTIGVPLMGAVSGAATGAYLDDENRLRGAAIGGPSGAVLSVLMRRGFSRQGLAKKAYNKLVSELKGTEKTQAQLDKNVRIAKSIEKTIRKETGTDFKFTQGQLNNDASTIALERRLARSGGGEDMSQAQRELSNTILDDFYAKKVTGIGSIKDFPAYVAKLKQELVAATKGAEDAVSTEVSRLSRHMDEQVMGKSIHGFLTKGKAAAKAEATRLFNKIPNVKLPSTNLNQGVDDLVRAEDGIIEPKTQQMLDLINRKIAKDGQPVDIGYSVLRKLRSRVGSNARAAGSGATPNLEDARQLGLLSDQIDAAMAQVKDVSPKIAQDYAKAKSFYATDYIPAFRQKTVSKILQRGPQGEDTKIAMANIAKSFNSLDGIDDLARAVGDDPSVAREAMKDFYSFDLLNFAQNKETLQLIPKKANAWLSRNAGKLRKLGIHDDFARVNKMQQTIEANAQNLDVFNKSVAGRVLEADMGKMIENSFRGSKNFAKTARELMDLAKGDPAATAGLQKAFAENIMKQSETTMPQFFQAGGTTSEVEFLKSLAKLTTQIRKYTPALREVYHKDPKRVKALNTVWKAYMALGRTAKSPVGTGSDTFELFGKSLDIVAGSTAPGKWYAFKTIRDSVDRFGQQHMDTFLRKAMFDPDYAQTLLEIAKGTVPEARLNQLMTITAYEIDKKLRPEESESE